MKIKYFFTSIFFLLTILSSSQAAESIFTDRADVKAFVDKMVEKHQFDRLILENYLNAAKLQPNIIKAMTKPAEKLPWYRYSPIFLSPQRIQDGAKFWKENENYLKQAQQEYGIPAEIIVSIIGVETFYGKNTGSYRVLDSLTTLAFDYPPRAPFFLSELEEFFLLAREEDWDPTEIKGSYAGAMGKGQFMPSSYRKFGIDFTHNGKRDLLNNNADAIASVANYFKSHGWTSNQLVIIPAKIKGGSHEKIIASKANPKPEYTLHDLAKWQVYTAQKAQPAWEKHRFALIKLENESGPAYWLGAQNFYVITRYNHSDHYAMAVYNLSQEIKNAYKNV